MGIDVESKEAIAQEWPVRIPPDKVHVPDQMAVDTGWEFNPATENHHFGFVVKAVDPGCTLEVQIEERSGRVTRITTTEDPKNDRRVIRDQVAEALERFMDAWGI